MEEKQTDGTGRRDPGAKIRRIVREEIEVILEEINRRQQEFLASLLNQG
ncbi:MAG: hypothetical protein KQI81_14100 [Deltaproteobacteria bacterium]|nr:hypothetical protein [Deltaproteobacteria bacterium]